jgi:hypothetical protein
VSPRAAPQFGTAAPFTMIASITFDPRLMWDAAEAGRSAAPKESGAVQEPPPDSHRQRLQNRPRHSNIEVYRGFLL